MGLKTHNLNLTRCKRKEVQKLALVLLFKMMNKRWDSVVNIPLHNKPENNWTIFNKKKQKQNSVFPDSKI